MSDTNSVVVRFNASQTSLEWVSEEGSMTCDPEFAQRYDSPQKAQEVADTVEDAQVHTLTE